MRLAHTFLTRPILATVLSVFVTLIGLGALVILPVLPPKQSRGLSQRRSSKRSMASRTCST